MRLRAWVIGTVGGLLIGGIIGALIGPVHYSDVQSVPLGEDGGQIVRVVMQYQPDAGPLVIPIYAQLLTAIGREVNVVWVVSKQADADDLHTRLGQAWPAGRSQILNVGKEISTWSKDRFVALRAAGRPGASVLCAPGRRRTANPLRTNDQEVPYRLVRDLPRFFGVQETDVDFDGGDFLATAHQLFAGSAIIEKNRPGAGARFRSTVELTTYLSRKMGRTITWLGDTPQQSPPHHLGMFLMVIGNTAAVGDVRLAETVVAAHPEVAKAFQVAGGIATPAFRADLTVRLDHVALQLRVLGFRVVRVPLLPSATPKAWMSYNNGIVETRHGQAIFYMPTFGAPALDAAAA